MSAPPRQEPPPPTAARRRRSEWGRGRGDRKEGGAESAGLDREGRGGGKVKGKGAGGSAGGEGCGRIQKVGVGGEIDREFRNSRLTVDSAFRSLYSGAVVPIEMYVLSDLLLYMSHSCVYVSTVQMTGGPASYTGHQAGRQRRRRDHRRNPYTTA